MNVNKLKKTIAKEFSRSPGKSITLLLLCPVAVYLCAPVFKGFLPKSTSNNGAVVSSDVAGAPFLLPLPAEAKTEVPEARSDWRKVVDWLAADQLAMPADLPQTVRSPFRYPNSVKTNSNEDPEQTTTADAEEKRNQPNATPTDVRRLFENRQLVLTTTMLGSRRRMATINRKMFSEGDVVPVTINTGSGTRRVVKLVLERVEPQSVLLTHGEASFQLDLSNRIPSDAIAVMPAAKDASE